MDIIISTLSQGLLWSILAIGLFITFRVLDLADLTTEGSFPLGAAITGVALNQNMNPIIATVLGFLGAALAGLITGILHTKLKIPTLLSGIITLTALYSVNLLIVGKANIPLPKQNTVLSVFQNLGFDRNMSALIVGAIVLMIVVSLLILFMKTELGMGLVATGNNQEMASANGIRIDAMKLFGYALANGLIGLSGSLLAQNNGFADMNMGVGVIVIGLASIILSEVLTGNVSLSKRFISLIGGSIVYRILWVAIVMLNVDSAMMKLASAIILTIVLCVPEIKAALGIKSSKALKGE